MNEVNRVHQTDNGGKAVRVRAISTAARPAPRVLQGSGPAVGRRRRKPFRLELFDSGYRRFRVR